MTMNLVQLQAVPNQELTCLLGGRLFGITVQLGPSNSTLLTVTVDGTTVISGHLSVANTSMMPAPQNKRFGNIGWLCEDGASYPTYQNFANGLHNLYWWDNA